MDLADLGHNLRDGLHMAALAGPWIALVAGFGGLRSSGGTLTLAPRLPAGLALLAFTVGVRGRRLQVAVTGNVATYTPSDDGPPLAIRHHGSPVTVSARQPQTCQVPAALPGPRPDQPPGREPARRPPGAELAGSWPAEVLPG